MSKPHNHKSKRLDPIKMFHGEPIIIPHTPEHLEDAPLPSDGRPWPLVILIGGTIAAGLCIWWVAPGLLRQIFSAVGW